MTSSICLQPFSPEEGADFLLGHFQSSDLTDQRESAVSLCNDVLGGLPLAIAHVAGYMTMFNEPMLPSEALDKLFKELQDSNDVFNTNPDTTFAYNKENKALNFVWDMALDELDPDSLKLIRVLSMLNASGVPEEMLRVATGSTSDECLQFLAKPRELQFQSMLQNLSRRQLITLSKPSGKTLLVTHRSLQRSILHKLDSSEPDEDEDSLQSVFDAALALLARQVLPGQSPIQFAKRGLWGRMELYSPHVMNLRKVYAESRHSQPPSIGFAQLLCAVANYFWERNLLTQALLACETAEQICAAFEGQLEHLKVRADVYTICGAIMCQEGLPMRRDSLFRLHKALCLRQEYTNSLNPDDATEDDLYNLANAWSNVGALLVDHDMFEPAIPYLDFAMEIRRGLNPASARQMNGESESLKSLCLAGLGKYDEAMGLIVPESEMQTWPKSFLDDVYLHTLIFKLRWSSIYLRVGRTEEAYALAHRVWDERCLVFQRSNRASLDTAFLLAMIEQKRGNHDAAK